MKHFLKYYFQFHHNVINRNKDKPIIADITGTGKGFTGKGQASIINSNDLTSIFTFDKQAQYEPVTKDVTASNGKINYTFPPHSFTQIKIMVHSK